MDRKRPGDAPARGSVRDREQQRAADVLAMHRLARKADDGQAILEWLARRTACPVALFDRSGNVLGGAPQAPEGAAVAAVVDAIARMRAGGLRVIVLDAPARDGGVALSVDGPDGQPDLVVAALGGHAGHVTVLADATAMIGGCRRLTAVDRDRRRLDAVDAQGREVVLHLLMSGHLSTAHQIASTLGPELRDPARVHVVECADHQRDDVIRACNELTAGRAWVVPCPVNADHVIVLHGVPDTPPLPPPARRPEPRPGLGFAATLAAQVDTCAVGIGEPLPLADTALGYEQAFHALAVARGRPRRWAAFDAMLDLSALLGHEGQAWADAFLQPLTAHRPARRTAPTSQDLTATTRSWLAFSTAATRHLKMHRNTVLAHLRAVEDLLDLDLNSTAGQATLDLAFRVRATPRQSSASAPRTPAPTLDQLLATPAAHHWATTLLAPVQAAPNTETLEATLHAWLRHDGRLSATGTALGITVAGTRKRLIRLEQLLHRSLLRPPSARYDLWLATRILDGPRPQTELS